MFINKTNSKFRILIGVAVILVAFLFLLFIFSAMSGALEVWNNLQQLPLTLYYSYMILISVGIPFSLWATYKLLEPVSIAEEREEDKSIFMLRILKELDKAEKIGIDITSIRNEIEVLKTRKNTGTIHVALFGDVSTGKSSIIKALLPDAQLNINVSGGSTPEIKEYTWKSTTGDKLILTDLPGRNEAEGILDLLTQEEAIRAQIVIYVTDSDLSRTQFNDIKLLNSFGKPLLLTLNKCDRFNDEEKKLFQEKFDKYFPNHSVQLIFIRSGGTEEILKIYPDGREEKFIRARKADVYQLAQALQDKIETQSSLLETLRDASVLKLIKQKLEGIKPAFRKKKSEAIIKYSTLKAVLGALVALSPGSDLVIQGVLGTLMIKQLCALYDIPMNQLDLDNNKLLNVNSDKRKKSIALISILAGNGMKSFPGIGTITGGLIHAVAYGLIVNTLGHAINKILKQQSQ